MRRAFSFTEILFAVMILGIGFIMIAAVFPVAIKQTAQSGEETVASSVAVEATGAMTSINTLNYLPPTINPSAPPVLLSPNPVRFIGQVWSMHDDRANNWAVPAAQRPAAGVQAKTMWDAICGNLILPFDRKTAWVALYRRDGSWQNVGGATLAVPDPYVQLVVIGIQNRTRSAYDPNVDIQRSLNSPTEPATLEPKLLTIDLNPQVDGPPVVRFTDPNREPDRTAEGAFLVISDDNLINAPTPPLQALAGQFNGHIYRLGALRRDMMGTAANAPPVYELAPGYDAFPPTVAFKSALAFVVGRGYANPANPGNSNNVAFDGPPQDVAVYTTFIRAN